MFDGMAIVHLIKNDNIVTLLDFAEHFNEFIFKKAGEYDELRIIFDPCPNDSLKSVTTAHMRQ